MSEDEDQDAPNVPIGFTPDQSFDGEAEETSAEAPKEEEGRVRFISKGRNLTLKELKSALQPSPSNPFREKFISSLLKKYHVNSIIEELNGPNMKQ